jgi:hypothetical protein
MQFRMKGSRTGRTRLKAACVHWKIDEELSVLRVPILLALAVPAMSCPVCHTETGDAVRQGIFNSDFGFNLFVTVLPFAVFYGIVALVHFGPTEFRPSQRKPAHRSDR